MDVFTYRSSTNPSFFVILEMSAVKKKKVDASDLFFSLFLFLYPSAASLYYMYIKKNGCSVVSVRGDVGVGMGVWVRESGFRKLPGETQLGHVRTLLSPCT